MHEHQGLDECLILLKLWLKRRALPGMHACVFACMCVKLWLRRRALSSRHGGMVCVFDSAVTSVSPIVL